MFSLVLLQGTAEDWLVGGGNVDLEVETVFVRDLAESCQKPDS